MNNKPKNNVYSKYPILNIFIYNTVTILHYVFGFIGILFALNFSTAANIIAAVYFCFAFFQMYVLMPLLVCPNCIYTRKSGMLCISGLNIISRKLKSKGDIKLFNSRNKGVLCHNNLYLAAKVIPLLIILPFLFINFSFILLSLFLIILGLLLLRIFYIFTKTACIHCLARNICPNAKSMGLSIS